MTSALRAWREQHDWTLVDVGGLTGLAVSYLSLIERGLREPTPEVKVRIARGIGAKVAEVFPAAGAASRGAWVRRQAQLNIAEGGADAA